MSMELINNIKENIRKIIIGKDEVIDLLLTALLANGHVLIDDVPGMGKTKLANSLAKSIGVNFKRIQFTPDLQPADITGIYYYNQKQGEFVFRGGPVLTNILLADEINRAVPRTQASLLEAMEEQQVTVEGNPFNLDSPFMVIATQNPIELEGTFPLPEAQLDRFLMKVEMGYPSQSEEVSILKRFQKNDPISELKPVIDGNDVNNLKTQVKDVKVSDDLVKYISQLAAASRIHQRLRIGVSPRGSLSLLRASMAYAFVKGRDYVMPDDIKYLFPFVVKHRLILSYDSELYDESKEQIVDEILQQVTIPVEGNLNA